MEVKAVWCALFETNSLLKRLDNLYWSQNGISKVILTNYKTVKELSVHAAGLPNLEIIQMVQYNGLAFYQKLDGVGPVDNRPSPDKLHHFVKKK